MKDFYITITGYRNYYGMSVFDLGQVVKLKKDTENEYDKFAIAVYVPKYDKVAYVANSAETIARGTNSAKGIYDFFSNETKAVIDFIAGDFIIARLTEE